MGVVTARIVDQRGELVGALMVLPEDEVFAITSAGGVIRTAAAEVKQSGRQTMGVRLMNLAPGDSVVAVARNAEAASGTEVDDDEADDEDLSAADEAPVSSPAAEADVGLTAGEPSDG
jgi:DNA gyrase subunit A